MSSLEIIFLFAVIDQEQLLTSNGIYEKRCFPNNFSYSAIQMKPDFISAWALIGHEYIELRSFAQAINAYHKGISLDPTDCRAWFGLGNAHIDIKFCN